ncbi:protein singed-like [Sycon ciliatum]|uniref:protein singed-like n=1 Tax=Sycon ciliatum TaxID=27933 RepID=UPI0020AED2FE|eukprot:scpid58044/ scgid11663/ Protein singed
MAAPTQTCGLINAANNKYLTGEKFGFTVNANGATIKSKQIWQIVSKEGSEHVFLRSPHNRYLAATEKGVVTADSEEMSGNAAFFFEPQKSGRVAFKSVHNYYFGGEGDKLSCFSKTVGDQESWIIHLANHPQFVLRNVQRKCYVTCDEKANEMRTTEEHPWGAEAVITLEFDRPSGSYLLRASNNMVLSQSGKLINDVNEDSRFQVEFRSGYVAFRASNGKYLAGVGSTGALQARREKVDKDALFALEDSLPQIQLISHSGKYVSIARGVEVSASQSEPTTKEIFQLTWADGKVALRSASGKFVSASSSSLQDNGEEASGDNLYEIAFNGATVTFKANSGRYVITKPNGTLSATGDSAEEPKAVFTLNIVNRPLLVLRGEHGFVSTVPTSKDKRYEANRSMYEVLSVNVESGIYTLKGANGQNVSQIENKTFSANGGEPARFHFEIQPNSRMALRLVGGALLKGVSNGGFSESGEEIGKETVFEY